MDATLQRLAPLSGVAFVALYVAGVAIGLADAPDFAAKPDEIKSYFQQNDSDIIIGGWIALLSVPFWFIFLSCVRAAIAKAEKKTGRLASLAYGSGVAAAAVGVPGVALGIMGGLRVDEAGTIDPATATVLFDASQVLAFTAVAAILSAFALAVGVASFRYGVFPKWLGGLFLVLAVVYLVLPISWAAIPAGLVLTLIVSGLLYQQKAGTL